jgi:hypothetical protein
MSYFFRYRRVGIVPIFAIAGVYYSVFETVNSILYKALVDKRVLSEARSLGLEAHA